VVGEAVDGVEAIAKVGEIKPEIVVMDITMPNLSGIEATEEVLKASPDVKIIALSIHSGQQFVKEMLKAGAVGYLLKDEAPEELLRAVEKVKNGEMFLSSGVTRAALSEDKKEDIIENINILQTKLNRPRIMDDYIIRQKIIDELENNFIKPLSVISAGAGYGKSVTVSEWLEQSNYMGSWLSLDMEHNDLRTFLLYFNAAIEKIFPEAMQETWGLLTAGALPPFNVIFNSFINEICNIEQDFILVLDDFQMLSEKEIHRFFDQWLQFPPPNVHLSIITRRDPPLDINKLRNSGRMIEIRMDDLSFSDEEILELYKKLLGVELSDKSIKLLQDKTEGWVIGLRLASMTIKDEEDVERILQAFEDNMNSVSDYLISEVLAKQPEHIMEQLIDSSVLNRFCAECIDEVLLAKNKDKQKDTDGSNLIQWLLESNMFLISIDSEQHWFRYHHLFQELLQNQLLKRRTLKEVQEIHNRAGKWFEKNDLIAEAIYHSIKAKDIDWAIQIINDNWEDTFDKDHWYIVEEWLKLIPEEVIVQSCKLLLARLWIAQKKHRGQDIPAIIESIEQCDNTLNDTEIGYLAFANCMNSLFKGEVKKALSFADQALELIPKKHYIFRADTYGWWTVIMQISGKGEQAVQAAKKALKNIDPPGEPIQLSRRTMHPNFVYMIIADLPSVKKSIKPFFKLPGNSPYMVAFGWYFQGAINWWSYKLEDAISDFDNTIKYQYQCRPRIVIEAYICKSLALQELKRPMEAKEAMIRGIQFAEDSEDPENIALMASGQVRLNLLQRELGSAEEWFTTTKHVGLEATMFWWVEVSAITQCRVLIALGTPESIDEALVKLIEFEIYSKSIYNNLRVIEVLVLQAHAYTKANKKEDAVKSLEEALNLAADGGFIRPFIENGNDLHALYISLKEKGVQPEFVEKILAEIEKNVDVKSEDPSPKHKKSDRSSQDQSIPLTRKEIEILQLISDGFRNREIADKLFNSEETIKKHISNMFQKLNVHNRLNLASKARELGMLETKDANKSELK